MKRYIIMFVLILFSQAAYALMECGPSIEPDDIPCRITSTWNYTSPCNAHLAQFYNETSAKVENYTFDEFGMTGLCNMTFNISRPGTYNFIVDNGDTGLIKVGVDTVQFAITGGFLYIFLLIIWIAFLAMTFIIPGRTGKHINFFNIMQGLTGLVLGIMVIPYTVIVGFTMLIISIGIFVGLNLYDRV